MGVLKKFIYHTELSKEKIENIQLITFDNKKKSSFSKEIKILNPLFNLEIFKGRYPKYILCLIYLIKILIFDRNYLILSFQANIYVLIISKIFKIKVISRSNSSSEGWSKNFFKQMIFSFFFKRADKIIVNSLDFKKEMDRKI